MKKPGGATFIVKIQHRQNASWQGQLTWAEEGKTSNYRSIWEMIKLMESALPPEKEPEWEETSGRE